MSDPEKRKVYDERGEKGVTGEDKDMTDGGEGGGGGCSCCCGAKAYIDKFGFAAYAAMTGMVSDSEEEDLDEEEEEPEEDEDEEDDDEEIGLSSGGVNPNPIPIILNPNVRPMMYGNPNIRPMYANAGVRPIYNVNNSTNPMNVVRPIIINGVQVGTYTRPANPMNMRPGNPGNPNMSGPFMRPAVVNPAVRPVNPVKPTSSATKDSGETDAAPERKRRVEVLDEAKKREVLNEAKKRSRWEPEEEN